MLPFVLVIVLPHVFGEQLCQSDEEHCSTKKRVQSARAVKWLDEIPSLEDLFKFSEPVLVQGFSADAMRSAHQAWTEAVVQRSLGDTLLSSRSSVVPVFRFGNHSDSALPGFGTRIKFSTHAYDAWAEVNKTFQEVMHPAPGLVTISMINKPDISDFGHPAGREALIDVVNSICSAGICSESKHFKLATGLWLASAGVNRQLHFDEEHTILFQLSGTKAVVMQSPSDVLEQSFLSPFLHPAHRHSQIQWSSNPAFRLSGLSVNERLLVPAIPTSMTGDRELRSVLRPGDVLFVPRFWGRHMVTSTDGPSMSFSTVWTRPGDRTDELEEELRLGLATFFGQVGLVASSAVDYWAAIRSGARLLVLLTCRNETDIFLNRWLAQRWQIQFDEWGISKLANQSRSEAPEQFCRATSESVLTEGPRSSLKSLLEILRKLASRRGPALETLVLRSYVANVLDMIPFLAFAQGTFRYRDLDRSHSAAAVAGFLLRSLGGCRDHKKSAKPSFAKEMQRFKDFVEKRDKESDDKEDVKRLRALVEQIETERNKKRRQEMLYKATTIMDAWTNGVFEDLATKEREWEKSFTEL